MKKKPFKITAEGLKNLIAELAALKPKPKSEYSAREMLVEAEVEIRDALTHGHDLHDIAEIVGKHGGDINASTLASYLRELKTKPQGKSAKHKKKAGRMDVTPTATPIPTDQPTSTPAGLSPVRADAERDRQQEEAILDHLLDQLSSTSDS
ncbi:MAG: hypothetical protein II336_08905 [Loktanella sp.]|nr:hypothetical protein [Loktanella sp.]